MSTKDGKTAAGVYNGGRFSDPKLDAMIQQIKVEMDTPKRDALIHDALQADQGRVLLPALHHQIRPWAMQKNVDTVHRADDAVPCPPGRPSSKCKNHSCLRTIYQHFRQKMP